MNTIARNILVIEDDQNVLEAILNILEYAEYQPHGETRFTERIFCQLQTDHVDLLILDVMLSGTDGRDLATRIKSNEKTRGIPILMISAYPEIEASVMNAGANDFLQKPFGLDELLQKVERQIKVEV